MLNGEGPGTSKSSKNRKKKGAKKAAAAANAAPVTSQLSTATQDGSSIPEVAEEDVDSEGGWSVKKVKSKGRNDFTLPYNPPKTSPEFLFDGRAQQTAGWNEGRHAKVQNHTVSKEDVTSLTAVDLLTCRWEATIERTHDPQEAEFARDMIAAIRMSLTEANMHADLS